MPPYQPSADRRHEIPTTRNGRLPFARRLDPSRCDIAVIDPGEA
ncbi:hypothetical protein OG909_10285 [Streptomyces sp. NBC_01754]|nr:hypothetical protein [Streptomyces sp. NBC_01754]WSC92651.1 hypothetical protein OG909_10285 [Streptomyces sp. NBC_01754]